MQDFAELKRQGEALEAAGKTREALGLLRLAIREIEGTPAMLRELALLAKVGDLHEALGEHDEACDAWAHAGKYYAEHGSSQGVIALCTKIHRVDKARTIVYPRLAQIMVDGNHLAAAREVLLKYTERAQAQRATDVLTKLEGADDNTLRPGLARVLDAVLKAEETRARRRVEETAPEPPPMDEPAAAAVPEPEPEPPEPEFEIIHDTASDVPPPVAHEPAPEPEPELEPEPEPEPEEYEEASVPYRVSVPMSRLPDPTPPARPARSPVPFLAVGLGVGLVLGAVLSQLGIIPRFLGGDGTEPPALTDSPAFVAPPMEPVSPAFAADSAPTVIPAPPTQAALATAPRDTNLVTTPSAPRDTLPAPAAITPVAAAPTEATIENPIAVDGFPIVAVAEHEAGGQSGYRVLQLLSAGDTLELIILPLIDPATPETPVMTATAAGATGYRAFGGMLVDARAPLTADSLRVLLERLGGGGSQ